MSNDLAIALSDAQRQRIDNGAELLDSRLGFNWAFKVDLKTFDINSFSSCVLGQVFDCSYSDAVARLELKGDNEAAEYGFYPHLDDPAKDLELASAEAMAYSDELAVLKTNYWGELIRQRRVQLKGEAK